MFPPVRVISVVLLCLLAGCSVFSFGGSETGIGGLEGTVVDHEGTGIRGASITITAPGQAAAIASGTTDYHGDFKIDRIPAQRNLTVRVIKQFRAATLQWEKKDVRIGGGHVTDLGDVELKPALD